MQLAYVNSIFAVVGSNVSGVYSYGEYHSISADEGGMWV